MIVPLATDRKSTRLNSSHGYISYAVFCLKKKKFTRCRSSVSPAPASDGSPTSVEIPPPPFQPLPVEKALLANAAIELTDSFTETCPEVRPRPAGLEWQLPIVSPMSLRLHYEDDDSRKRPR